MPTSEDMKRALHISNSPPEVDIEHLSALRKLIDSDFTPPKLVKGAKDKFRLVAKYHLSFLREQRN
jgi:hypothetical protein